MGPSHFVAQACLEDRSSAITVPDGATILQMLWTDDGTGALIVENMP
jgi:hypothetical protein